MTVDFLPPDQALVEDALVAADLCRGTLRLLADRGESGLTEVRLGNGRRADILALDGGGRITIVEIKSWSRISGRTPSGRTIWIIATASILPWRATSRPTSCRWSMA